ncbi:MAG: sigma-54-dependent Fis family transcriptional regulator [Gemmatimonadetes bacterium]|nr:MAG: sigma-54-dependent Fis family transcriptional regulator [Gemmatimonadota bacterium]
MEIAPAKILIIEDEASVGRVLKAGFASIGYDVTQIGDGQEGMDLINREVYDLVISDYMLPNVPGDEILRQVNQVSPYTATMLITAHGKIDHAVELLQQGIDDYITKPFNLKDVIVRVNRLIDRQQLRHQVDLLQKQVRDKNLSDSIIGRSLAIQNVLKQIATVANADVPVVIEGESGVGKELVARAIHYSGNRAGNPFIAINCGALPESLLESELFGHMRGAFTGADRHSVGIIEEASHGTLFLDEVTEMSQATQVKLLRALQENEIRRVGSSRPIKVDVRFIAATNKNLREEVEKKQFREDLYYRLNVMNIYVPPLRDRREDIPLLSCHFIEKYAQKFNKGVVEFSAEAMQKLMAGEWVGNIRELENVIQRAVLITRTSVISPEDIGISIFSNDPDASATLPFKEAKQQAVSQFERSYISHLLTLCKGNMTAAARKAGIDKKNFWQKMKKYNISLDQYKS